MPDAHRRPGPDRGLFIAALVTLVAGHLAGGSRPLLGEARVVAAIGLVLAVLAAVVVGPGGFRGPWGRVAAVLGGAAATLGAAAVVWGGAPAAGEVLLALFVGATVLTSLVALGVDVGALPGGHRRPQIHRP